MTRRRRAMRVSVLVTMLLIVKSEDVVSEMTRWLGVPAMEVQIAVCDCLAVVDGVSRARWRARQTNAVVCGLLVITVGRNVYRRSHPVIGGG